ncbi:hypothetical protein [Leptolyngbya boryana]|uniref:hypothetical protein n=1 Tax=Leptolyngbya boryana TaxID=1184 RepID=UPI000166005C|nr:hypothetical protein [Leptolyngbya boryana]
MDLIKVYPCGQITASSQRRFTPEPLPREKKLTVDEAFNLSALKSFGYERAREILQAEGYLGLSKPAKSEKTKKPRGQKGITSHGRRIIRGGVTLLERTYGRNRLSFITLTLPPAVAEDLSGRWAHVVDLMKRRLIYSNGLHGLPTEIIACTEVQEKRYERTGEVALHLHIVMVGRHSRGAWCYSPRQLEKMWSECCETAVRNVIEPNERVTSRVTNSRTESESNGNGNATGNTSSNANSNGNANGNIHTEVNWNAAVNVQRIKKSASAYMGKYLSKGTQTTQKIIDSGKAHLLPKAWYFCTQVLLERIKKATRVVSGNLAHEIYEHVLSHATEYLNYHRNIKAKCSDGREITVGWYGYLTKRGMQELGKPLGVV